MNTMSPHPTLNQDAQVIRQDRLKSIRRRNQRSAFFHAASFVLTVGGTVLKIVGKGILLSGRLLKPKKRSRL